MPRRLGILSLSALSLALSACGSAPPKSSRVPLSALPDENRAMIESWRAGSETWERERARWVGEPQLVDFLVDNLVIDMVRSYDRARLALPGEPRGPFERARDELARLHERSSPVMVEMLCTGDGVQAFLARDVLRSAGRPCVPAVVQALSRSDPDARRRAAELLGELPHGGSAEDDALEALARLAERDPEWIVRAQAARALGIRAARHTTHEVARRALLEAVGDGDRTVRDEAARGLAALGDPKLVPALVDYLERCEREGNPRGVSTAQECLMTLTGTTQRRDVVGWRAWLREHSKTGKENG